MFVELKIEEKKLSNFFLSCLSRFERAGSRPFESAISNHQVLAVQIERRAAPAVSAAKLKTVPYEAPDSSWMKINYQSLDLWSIISFLSL